MPSVQLLKDNLRAAFKHKRGEGQGWLSQQCLRIIPHGRVTEFVYVINNTEWLILAKNFHS